MKYRKLGNTELAVSVISVGCSGYWGEKNYPEDKATKIIFEAFDRGVNFFDTGHNYCNFNAEPRLGRAIEEILKNHDRSNVIVSSKAGTIIPSGKILTIQNSNNKDGKNKDFSPDGIEQSCARSISNLNCDYLDIFQLHGITESEVTDPLIHRLRDMKQKGMYRYLGVNTHTEADMLFVSKHPDLFDMVLIDYNVLQLDRELIIERLSQAGLGVVAGTVLAQGHLIQGKIGSIKTKADLWYLARAILKRTSRNLANNSQAMRDTLSSITEMSAAQAAFAYILGNPNIASCVFGTTNITNMIEIIDAADRQLSEESKLAIKKTFKTIKTKISG
jgi:aryl-alcohol dehydrogenase-like predicted oxidoreductase